MQNRVVKDRGGRLFQSSKWRPFRWWKQRIDAFCDIFYGHVLNLTLIWFSNRDKSHRKPCGTITQAILSTKKWRALAFPLLICIAQSSYAQSSYYTCWPVQPGSQTMNVSDPLEAGAYYADYLL